MLETRYDVSHPPAMNAPPDRKREATATLLDSRPLDARPLDARAAGIVAALAGRSIALVGMMGAGKTSIGRRLAQALGLGFVDCDAEIESAAGMSVSEIFERHGEPYFRDGERRVIARVLNEGARVVATGGGAFMLAATRERIAEKAVSIWLKADAEVLLRRVRKRANRPLLMTSDPEQTMRELIAHRYPFYALADIVVASGDSPQEAALDEVLRALAAMLTTPACPTPAPDGPIVVPVALGRRRYDICIGEDLLASAGARIAALAPGAACAIVTDSQCGPSLLAGAGGEPHIGGRTLATHRHRGGRKLESLGAAGARLRGDHRGAARTPRPRRRVGRRRRRGPRRLRGGDRAARDAFRAGSHDPPGASRFLRRRQDGDQRRAGQEPRRRFSTSQASSSPISARSPPCPHANFAPAMRKWRNTA